ncbi:type II toxin-antitoxin system RelE/ParE family toxin [Mesorhizobium sp.]|uniref:type II toxin-antitoxin system RelE/ParE family toxin n=1 Tax=Mesorhizobium sp. TaxID=1871066 RepID=UPI000FE58C69|nr:type II toxin-antitoxin system RelE/ParE family toxin [Mesorhizobium sp.]RWK56000.1 MAG: type II toxin-antitoxin system RelE/ParE family toxin [Mesorhizobium sp.]RWK73434.1 MAG: type II toxin-antitoxin system RelE/ParE family toxin [Mesorhizobium sp.]TIP48128.1 MAG: type II toxin-antitoxin system RelE/ParE family toxin [Mesorhizobium sp.]
MAVIFSPAAAQDIEEIGDFIHAENPAAAMRFVTAIRARCSRIVDAPHGGVPRPALWSGLRSVAYQRYVIFYTVEGAAIRIERILHGARDIEAIFYEGDS